MSEIKKWYSFAENGAYQGPEPSFFDVKNKEWSTLLEKNYEVILKEFQKLIEARDKNIVPYMNQTLADKANNWNVFVLYSWCNKKEENCTKTPATTQLIESIPGMTSCLFSVLKADTRIKPHYGDSNVMYRCHLTLNCKGSLPEIGMRIRDQKTSWENGKLFAFCDAHEHEVWNNTKEDRWVMIIDILREEFIDQKKKICSEVNATLWWQLKFQNFYFLKHVPSWGRKMVLKVSSWFF